MLYEARTVINTMMMVVNGRRYCVYDSDLQELPYSCRAISRMHIGPLYEEGKFQLI